MISERALTTIVKSILKHKLVLQPTKDTRLPAPMPGRKYMLYLHIPFCSVLCPYCSFNRYKFKEDVARPYFANLRREMMMLADMGYDIESLYFGGGTPTIMMDELIATIDLARRTWDIQEVSAETNPNHLVPEYLEQMEGRIQRLSVGVQSFNDDLLRQMVRYEKYGSGEVIYERIGAAAPHFNCLAVDMIFNFPTETEDVLLHDLEAIATCGCDQTTFSPLYMSNATTAKMVEALGGTMDYEREQRFYAIIDGVLAGGEHPLFERRTLWTFNRESAMGASAHGASANAGVCTQGAGVGGLDVDEFMVGYDAYPAIGSGAITHLAGNLFVNTFSLTDYNERIEAGNMSVMGRAPLSRRDLMRYRFLVSLYQLRLDKLAFVREFGCTIDQGLPFEMSFMRAHDAFEVDNERELTLTPEGRYLTLVMYRQFLSGMNNLRDQARAALTGPERELMFED